MIKSMAHGLSISKIRHQFAVGQRLVSVNSAGDRVVWTLQSIIARNYKLTLESPNPIMEPTFFCKKDYLLWRMEEGTLVLESTESSAKLAPFDGPEKRRRAPREKTQ